MWLRRKYRTGRKHKSIEESDSENKNDVGKKKEKSVKSILNEFKES